MDDKKLAKLLGVRVKNIRERHGLSQSELSATLGFTQQYLSSIERGKRVLPTETLVEICALFDLPMNVFELSAMELREIGL